MCGGLALGREVGGQDHLLHLAILSGRQLAGTVARADPVKQLLQTNVMRANAVQRAELAHEHKIQAFVGQGALHGGLVGRGFDHTQLAAVALRVLAGGAHLLLGERVAQAAMAHMVDRMLQGVGDLQGAWLVVLQQMKGHARGRLGAHAGQTAQGVCQSVKGIAVGHGERRLQW